MKVPKRLESSIEKAVSDYAEKKGCLVFKFESPGTRGVPDRIFIKNGTVLFCEFKRQGQKPRTFQLHIIREMKRAGANVEIIDNVDDGKRLIDSFI